MTGPDAKWVRRLKPGARVSVCVWGGEVWVGIVRRITPTGRVVVVNWASQEEPDAREVTFNPDGYQRDAIYKLRYLAPPEGQ